MAPYSRRPSRALPWTLFTLGCAAHAPSDFVAPLAPVGEAAPIRDPDPPPSEPIVATSASPSAAPIVEAPPSLPPPTAEPPRVTLTALSMAVNVMSGADARGVVLGYLRRGTAVEARRGPLPGRGCPYRDGSTDGWYELLSGGHVCVGGGSVARAEDVSPGQRHRFPTPPRDAALPYTYALSLSPVVMYRRLPTLDDERAAEPERFNPSPASTPVPQEADARTTPHHHTLAELNGEEGTPVLRRLTRGMHVALDRQMRSETRVRWWRTQSGGYVRSGVLDTVGARTWEGAHLDAHTQLPLAFVASSEAWLYRRAATEGLEPESRAPRLAVYALTDDAPLAWRDERWYATTDGHYLRARNIRTVIGRTPPPDLADDERWIDVNVSQQTLVAYEGARAVFATLVSTGVPAPGRLTHETVRGDFRIESKHWTTTMDGDTVGGGAYSIEEVPWVMYFHGSYALHAAFWHSAFGYVHSHGCVNLSPPDARWLFGWTSPTLPAAWHGVKATRDHPGTRVLVHGEDA